MGKCQQRKGKSTEEKGKWGKEKVERGKCIGKRGTKAYSLQQKDKSKDSLRFSKPKVFTLILVFPCKLIISHNMILQKI